MRFPFFLSIIIPAFSISSALARLNHASTRSHDHPSIARRQHQFPRLLSDTCARIEASALTSAVVDLIDDLDLPDTNLDLFAKADICLCLSSITLFVKIDVRTQAVVALIGEEKVDLMLRNLITGSSRGQSCHFPDRAIPRPTRAQGCNSCDFTCEKTWEKVGDKCVCKSPMIDCRGTCANNCGSATPRTREETDSHGEMELPEIVTYEQARETCDPYDTICGIENRPDCYGCYDILNNRRNCGGCVWPHPFGSPVSPQGRDCDEIEGKKTSWCDSGKCQVKECKEGWKPNQDSTLCLKIEMNRDVNVDL